MVHTATAAVLAAALCLLSPPAGAVSVPERPLMRQWVFDAASLLSPAARTGYGAGNEGHFVGLHGHKLTFGTCAPKPWEYKVVEVVEGAYNDTAWGLVFRASTSARKAMQSNFQKEILVLQARSGKSTQFSLAPKMWHPLRESVHYMVSNRPTLAKLQMLPPQEEALVEECSRQPVAQSYLDAILGQIMQQVPGELGRQAASQWLASVDNWDAQRIVQDREYPRTRAPLTDPRRHTRGNAAPPLTEGLERSIDALMSKQKLKDGRSVLSLRVAEPQLWICRGRNCPEAAAKPPSGQGMVRH